jgi:hypothetical protein
MIGDRVVQGRFIAFGGVVNHLVKEAANAVFELFLGVDLQHRAGKILASKIDESRFDNH